MCGRQRISASRDCPVVESDLVVPFTTERPCESRVVGKVPFGSGHHDHGVTTVFCLFVTQIQPVCGPERLYDIVIIQEFACFFVPFVIGKEDIGIQECDLLVPFRNALLQQATEAFLVKHVRVTSDMKCFFEFGRIVSKDEFYDKNGESLGFVIVPHVECVHDNAFGLRRIEHDDSYRHVVRL